MSCEWSYLCRTCNEQSDWGITYYGDGRLLKILNNYQLILDFMKLANHLDIFDYRILGDHTNCLPEFLDRHHLHDVCVISEYGEIIEPECPGL